MEKTIHHYRAFFRDGACMSSFLQAVALLLLAAFAVFSAVSYATVHASNHVTDIILSNIKPVNVRFLFIYGTFAQFVILAALLLLRPRRLPFALKGIALFLLIRAIFITLTHLGPFPIDPQKPAPLFNSIFYGGDLFFSGHTGLPFLGALVFWHVKALRYFYLASTVFFATVVLLGHYHYSIDVFAALFISYGIFQIAVWLFPRDHALFRSAEEGVEGHALAPQAQFTR